MSELRLALESVLYSMQELISEVKCHQGAFPTTTCSPSIRTKNHTVGKLEGFDDHGKESIKFATLHVDRPQLENA
jgi:hypothetical protein